MSRKFHYYNVFITLNNEATLLHFSDFLDRVRNIRWQNRLRKVRSHPTALFHVEVPVADTNCRKVALGKYRQQVKPYLGDINTDQATMIQNDIIEMVSFVVAPMSRTVLLEYNFFGSKLKDIEEYFNSFFSKQDPAQQWGITFMPVASSKSLEDVRVSEDIKSVQLKMNTETESFETLLYSARNGQQGNYLVSSILKLMGKIYEDTDAPVIDLKFGKGRKKKIELDSIEIIRLLDQLDIDNNEAIVSCSVNFKNSRTGKYEDLELKNARVKHEIFMENSTATSWESIGDEILNKYIQQQRQGSAALRNITYSDITRFPDLLEIASEEYFISVQEGERDLDDTAN